MKHLMIPLLLMSAAPAAAAPRTETAVLAGGCFWGMEWVFEHVKGVANVVSGYAGGARGAGCLPSTVRGLRRYTFSRFAVE